MITLTEPAASKLKELLASQEESKRNLRIKVAGGGCSGFQYQLVFDGIKKGDVISEHFGVKVLCDPKSYLYLNGSTVDFVDGLMGSGFQLDNPNAKGTCGCGQSFHA